MPEATGKYKAKVYDVVSDEWVPLFDDIVVETGSDTVKGIVNLSDAINSTLNAENGGTAATPLASIMSGSVIISAEKTQSPSRATSIEALCSSVSGPSKENRTWSTYPAPTRSSRASGCIPSVLRTTVM